MSSSKLRCSNNRWVAAISPNPGLSLFPGSSLRHLARLKGSPLGDNSRCFLCRPQSQSKRIATTTTTNTTATTTTTTTTNCFTRLCYCRSLQPSPNWGSNVAPSCLRRLPTIGSPAAFAWLHAEGHPRTLKTASADTNSEPTKLEPTWLRSVLVVVAVVVMVVVVVVVVGGG